MLGIIAWRIPQIAVTLILLSLAAYLAIGAMPGDPISMAMMSDPRLGPADVERMRALHGLDQPLLARWWAWLTGVLRGEFGYSRLFARPAAEILWPALRGSLLLLGTALALAAILGTAAGVLAALRPAWRGAVDGLALLSQALPAFWLGILLIILFAVTLGWLPAGGAPEEPGMAEAARFLVLPTATLAIAHLAAYARHTAASMAEVLRAPWITAARARGAPERRIAMVHALPNAAVPLLAILALDAGVLVSGALITETVFARPGMGKLLTDAVMGNDHNLALLALLLVATTTLLATLAADLAQRALDPRIGAGR
ncbi:ABC transporter permease [Roseomonas sp. SSH11]|uniref:ABC transporter permease n=1 Tax=Pararoseomonas baculiformis TaxID=2820812 RepID=A0ABS4AGY5_9PROT|nr:ABC transporter permease [Pararoseomonas baculiformis]MBP0446297.1 ABC transporter permease [Pararoseomonas baculiformis]